VVVGRNSPSLEVRDSIPDLSATAVLITKKAPEFERVIRQSPVMSALNGHPCEAKNPVAQANTSSKPQKISI
jgi:hypothetical protein